MNLTARRNHKKHHNFPDTPSEVCKVNEGVEDTHHFIFECAHYATHRAPLAVKVIEILQRKKLNYLGNQLELYLLLNLCGHQSLNLIYNRKIL